MQSYEYDLSALVTSEFMLQAIAARGFTKLTFERAIEGGFRLVSHFSGDFRYLPAAYSQVTAPPIEASSESNTS